MTWLAIALALLKVSGAIIQYLNSQKLMDAGAAKEALQSLENANAAIEKGRNARKASNADTELHPDRVHDDDGFKRPD